jgi:hypothetical protein
MRDFKQLLPTVLLCLSLVSFAQQPATKSPEQPSSKNTEQSFASGGKVEMHLSGGDYEIVGIDANSIRVSSTGRNADQVKVSLGIENTSARISVQPKHSDNLHIRIEVPKRTDLIVRLSAGDLRLKGIVGNKDIECHAGDLNVDVGDPDSYNQIDSSVNTGDLNASAFGVQKDGLFRSFNQTRRGQYRLHVHLGAGDLNLTSGAQ